MTSGIGTVGTVASVAVTQPVVAPAAPVASAPATTAPLTPSVPSPNQKIVFDPQAGLIDQYLNNVGSITVQVPSAVVVAYLHAGLTATGLPKTATAGANA